MRYRSLGRTGVKISSIGLGTATFGVAPLEEDADQLVGRALDLGINLFDTANSYGNQSRFDRDHAPPADARKSAEEILGTALTGRRQDVVLCSKVMEPVGEGPNDAGLSRLHIFNQVEASLRRLRTDYLDVYYAHHPDPNTPVEQTISAFNDLVRQGKIRYYALSTFSAWEMTEALWASDRLSAHGPVCNQLSYSLGNREIEEDLIPACLHFGLTVMAFSPLAGGLLAGEEAIHRPVIGPKRFGYEGFSDAQLNIAKQLNRISKEWNIAPATLALGWLTTRPAVSSAIIGAETVQELETSAKAMDVELDPALLDEVDEINRPTPRTWY